MLIGGYLIGWHTRKHGVGPVGLLLVVCEFVVEHFFGHPLKLTDIILLKGIAVIKWRKINGRQNHKKHQRYKVW